MERVAKFLSENRLVLIDSGDVCCIDASPEFGFYEEYPVLSIRGYITDYLRGVDIDREDREYVRYLTRDEVKALCLTDAVYALLSIGVIKKTGEVIEDEGILCA